VGHAAARGPAADHREGDEALRHRRLPRREGDRHGRPDQHDHAVCFFAISGVLPRDEAIQKIKDAIKKTYGKPRARRSSSKNFTRSTRRSRTCTRPTLPGEVTSTLELPPVVSDEGAGVRPKVTPEIIAGRGDDLPVSAFRCDGTFPTATSQWEKRSIALEIPVWDEDVCIQCGKCALVCPHAAIRMKIYDPSQLRGAPATFKSVDFKARTSRTSS
jgi:pyruvate-ferredoxin/flavodoxin oxidoreductase